MALFCAAIRRDSVSLLRFPFLIDVYIFPCEISPVCRLKNTYSYLSPHFCIHTIAFFLFVFVVSVMILATIISLSLPFLM